MRSGQRMNDDNIPILYNTASVYFMDAFSSLHVAYEARYDIIIIIVINTHTVCSSYDRFRFNYSSRDHGRQNQ